MGKKPSWFSAIKRVFASNSKEKLDDFGSEKLKSPKKKKWGLGRLRHSGDGSNSFILGLNREPSSIEQILLDAERELQIVPIKFPEVSSEQPPRLEAPPPPPLPLALPPPPPPVSNEQHQRKPSDPMPSRAVSNHHHKEVIGHNSIIISPTMNHQVSAIKIQAAFRGFMARRSFRALKGLVRLQGVMRGQSIKRQTMNAMKQMQLLVRVQNQIQSRRIQMLDTNKGDRELESNSLAKWSTTLASARQQEDWDDSQLTKEEEEARLQRKVEAVIKRERALAYAYSNQLWKATPNSAKAALVDIRSGGVPWWWNWVERELPGYPSEIHSSTMQSFRADQISHQLTPPRPLPLPDSSNLRRPPSSHNETQLTPRSSKSVVTTAATAANNRTTTSATTTTATTPVMKHAKPRKTGAAAAAPGLSLDDTPLRDDASLTSCPAFSVPNYMVPTVSAKAKARMANTNMKEREMELGSGNDRKRRLSFPLSQSIGSLRWNKVFSSKDSSSHRMLQKNHTMQSMDNLSMDSTLSLPVGLGNRKPFKRFV